MVEIGNGDGDKKELSTHIVETVQIVPGSNLSRDIEAAYTRLGDRAKAEESYILTVTQAVSVPYVVLTAQRISKADFERQQRMAQFGQSGGPRR